MFLWESVLYKIEAGKAAVFLVVGSMLQHGGVVAREYGKRIKDSWDAVPKESPKESCGASHNPELN